VAGIVTIEDLLEEIVGEIYDETDIVHESIKKVQNGYEIDGDTSLSDIRKKTKMNIKNGNDVKTIAGLVMDKIGRIPKKEDVVKYDGFEIKVLEMQDQMVAKVRLMKK
jgi:CBS domain containing-hemolysin-like protein